MDRHCRQYIRHPNTIPIQYRIDSEAEKCSLKDVSEGGLCFVSDCRLPVGDTIYINVPLAQSPHELKGVVSWCKPDSHQFLIGVSFKNDAALFTARMVEQVCHIESYREKMRQQGIVLTSEQAAEQWIAKYAEAFPDNNAAD